MSRPRNTPYTPQRSLFDFPVFAGSVSDFLALLHAEQSPRTIAYLNAHTVNLAHSDSSFRKLLLQKELLYADGMSLVRTASRVGRPLAERVNAGDFLPRFLWSCVVHQSSVAFVGSPPGVAEQAAQALVRGLPSNPVVFTHHGFFLADPDLKVNTLERLKELQPRFLLLGLGSPAQEQLAQEWSAVLPKTTIWCVGALFEYSAGRKRAPAWVRQLGAEWVVRLALEPRRLWKRYLIGNPKYLYHEYCWRKNL